MRRSVLVTTLISVSVVAAACGSAGQGVVGLRSDTKTSTIGTENTTGPDDTTGTGDTTNGSTDSTASTDSSGTADTLNPAGDPFRWKNVDGSSAVQEGHLVVPIDYSDPSLGTFTLVVARHKATSPSKRIGTLLVNRGGPGFPSIDFALQAENVYSENLLKYFDVVSWDPRGTGASKPAIDCVSDYDHFFTGTDITPDTPAEKQQIIDLAKEFETDCVTKNAKILQHVGTNDSARDIDSIRAALGEQKISYFGFSYGSELGATWATLFPQTVRVAVLDGASDPEAGYLESGLQQAKGFEDAIDTFLKLCDGDSECTFGNGDAESAFDALMKSLDDKPIPTVTGRPDLTRSMAITGVSEAMYTQSLWPALEKGLSDAQNGHGKGLLDLYDEYFQRQPDGTYDNSLEAFQVISCMDEAERLTVAQDDANAAQYIAVAPRANPSTVGAYMCTFLPKSDSPRITITGKGAGPILVVGTTGDPATPLASSQNMAKDLENGVLLTVVGDQHTGYSVNACSVATVDAYLIKQTMPKVGARCG